MSLYIDSLWHNELVLVDNRCLCIWIQCIRKYIPRDVSWPKLNPRTATETRRKTTFFMAADGRLLDLTIDRGVIYVSTVSNLNITRQKCAANRIAYPVTVNQLIWEYFRDQPTIREHYLKDHSNRACKLTGSLHPCVLLFMTGNPHQVIYKRIDISINRKDYVSTSLQWSIVDKNLFFKPVLWKKI